MKEIMKATRVKTAGFVNLAAAIFKRVLKAVSIPLCQNKIVRTMNTPARLPQYAL